VECGTAIGPAERGGGGCAKDADFTISAHSQNVAEELSNLTAIPWPTHTHLDTAHRVLGPTHQMSDGQFGCAVFFISAIINFAKRRSLATLLAAGAVPNSTRLRPSRSEWWVARLSATPQGYRLTGQSLRAGGGLLTRV